MRFAANDASLAPVSFLSALLLVWSVLLVAGMVVGVVGPLAAFGARPVATRNALPALAMLLHSSSARRRSSVG